jgi:hypothetical protein
MSQLSFEDEVKEIRINPLKYLTLMIPAMLVLTGCNYLKENGTFGSSSQSSTAQDVSPVVAGTGSTLPGVGALSMPTANATVQRIINGLEGHVQVVADNNNMAFAYRNLSGQLSNSADPTHFTGGDTTMLIAYAACTAVSGQMNTIYGVNGSLTVAANKTALVNAGMRILDHYLANLASQGSASTQVKAALNATVAQSISNGVSSSTMAFVTVCTAANTAGSTLMGF